MGCFDAYIQGLEETVVRGRSIILEGVPEGHYNHIFNNGGYSHQELDFAQVKSKRSGLAMMVTRNSGGQM